MRTIIFLFIAIGMITINSCKNKDDNNKLVYPETAKVDMVDNYFGTEVADPYRWLEDDNSQETAEWVNAQNKVTQTYLEKIPFREKIKNRLSEIWNYPRQGVPFKKKDNYFYFKNDGMQNQDVLYILDSLDAEAKVFLDPNKLSDDGTVALAGMSFSNDGKLVAYSISRAGSDWNEIYVMETEGAKKLDDKLEWIKFSGMAWHNNGFFYSRYDKPAEGSELSGKNEFHKIYYHKIGTSQEEDNLVFENKEFPLRSYFAETTDDEKYLIISESESTSGNALYVKDLSNEANDIKLIAKGFDYEYNVVDNIDKKLLVVTNHKAPKNQLVIIDPLKPEESNWIVLIPEAKNVLESVKQIGGKLIVQYMKDASSIALVFEMDGKQTGEVQLPGIGSLSAFRGKKDDNIAFYSFTSYIFPTTLYKYDIESNTSVIYKKAEIDFKSDDYEVKQIFYKSNDGTKVPMFVVHKKGLKLDGNNPCFLYGYGGFNISLTPDFRVSRLPFLENGGVYVVANIRGGGEYGEEWHKAGTVLQKQNVFDDFIAAAEYLIENKYTNSSKLAISGGSNGGLLVGACMTQRPELFKVALPAVGVLDMLRYHKFTIGWAWATDYGTSEKKEEFEYLYKYSPLHNIKEGVEYPATMVTTADHDDRVVPAHSFKFIAELQAKHKGNNPVLIRIETKAGHGAGKPTSKQIEEMADIWSFVFYNMGITPNY